MEFCQKENYTIADLLTIVALLRDPDNGCPWDKVQTHHTIRMNFIEETYEVVDAIDAEDTEGLCEELGDILLQVALHTQMEEEQNNFSFNDVCDGICKKLIYRHPHVFGSVEADSADEVLKNWNELKKAEKNQTTVTSQLNAVPKAFPALMRAAKIQKRAGALGLDYPDAATALQDLESELKELAAAQSRDEQMDELGDVLFSVVNTARMMGIDPELALTRSTDKFASRAKAVETMASHQSDSLSELSPEQLDAFWQRAKQCFP